MTTQPEHGVPLYQRILEGGETLSFGLLGERLGHSHSPRIHALLGSEPYECVEVPPDQVEALIRSRRYRGLNVTIPYKKVAASCADARSEAVERLGNSNTLVVRPDGSLFADNTDYYGFSCQLDSIHADVEGKACLVLGDGGAAATVRAVLADRGASRVVTATRRGDLTFEDLRGACPAPARADLAREVLQQTVLVVNATPVGMFPRAQDAPLVDLERFEALRYVCDLVYNPLNTRLVQQAKQLDIACCGGLLMLVAQAKRSSDLFLGVERPAQVEDEVYRALHDRLSVVSLIGMPGCGKTRTGMALAEMLGFDFVDVDDLVSARAGKPIPRIFEEDGEEAFRSLETLCTQEATSRPGRVVATGGGVVTRERNLPLLRQNGPVVLLTRGLVEDPLDALAVEGRPLSQQRGLGRLREERSALYHAWADIEVAPSEGGAASTARRIARMVRRV